WHGGFGSEATQGSGRGEPTPEADVRRPEHRQCPDEGVDRKKVVIPAQRRELAHYLIEDHQASKQRASRCTGMSRSSLYYQPKPRDDGDVIELLTKLVEKYPRYGFDKLFSKIRALGHPWNHKRVHRVYQEMKLNLRRKHKRRYPLVDPKPLLQPIYPNRCWSMDFMSDALYGGMKFRTFNIVDDFNREVLTIAINNSITSQYVARTLEQLIEIRGVPDQIRMDHGPEFTSHHLREWCDLWAIEMVFTQPGKPTQNAFIERFNGTYRREVLECWCFKTLKEVREETERWIREYNTERPHQSLGDLSPILFLQQRGFGQFSIYAL
ncbi:MAG TPA: IS3 family transposase, partial [Arenicellales bacterium]|nr:IS3 family transposase [Arenicellales bacterium]